MTQRSVRREGIDEPSTFADWGRAAGGPQRRAGRLSSCVARCSGGWVCQVDGDRIDVRRQPPVVRDGCAPERTPAGRWPSDGVLVQSEQFAVNEILASLTPDGTGQSAVL